MRDNCAFYEKDVRMVEAGDTGELIRLARWEYEDGVVEHSFIYGEGAGSIELEADDTPEDIEAGMARMVELVEEQLEAASHQWGMWEMHLGWNWYLRLGFLCWHCGERRAREAHLVRDVHWILQPRPPKLLEVHHGSK